MVKCSFNHEMLLDQPIRFDISSSLEEVSQSSRVRERERGRDKHPPLHYISITVWYLAQPPVPATGSDNRQCSFHEINHKGREDMRWRSEKGWSCFLTFPSSTRTTPAFQLIHSNEKRLLHQYDITQCTGSCHHIQRGALLSRPQNVVSISAEEGCESSTSRFC